jgi:hypothetical protein
MAEGVRRRNADYERAHKLYNERHPCILDTGKKYLDRHWYIQPAGAVTVTVSGGLETVSMLSDMGVSSLQYSCALALFLVGVALFLSLALERPKSVTGSSTSSSPASSSSQTDLEAQGLLHPSSGEQYRSETHAPRTWCQSCAHWRLCRTHHCRRCGACIPRLDHHCVWIGRCVGRDNSHRFSMYLLLTTLFAFYACAVTIDCYFILHIRRP